MPEPISPWGGAVEGEQGRQMCVTHTEEGGHGAMVRFCQEVRPRAGTLVPHIGLSRASQKDTCRAL